MHLRPVRSSRDENATRAIAIRESRGLVGGLLAPSSSSGRPSRQRLTERACSCARRRSFATVALGSADGLTVKREPDRDA